MFLALICVDFFAGGLHTRTGVACYLSVTFLVTLLFLPCGGMGQGRRIRRK